MTSPVPRSVVGIAHTIFAQMIVKKVPQRGSEDDRLLTGTEYRPLLSLTSIGWCACVFNIIRSLNTSHESLSDGLDSIADVQGVRVTVCSVCVRACVW